MEVRQLLDVVSPSEQNCKEAEAPRLPGDRGDVMASQCEYGARESSNPASESPSASASIRNLLLKEGLAAASLPSWILTVSQLTSVEDS